MARVPYLLALPLLLLACADSGGDDEVGEFGTETDGAQTDSDESSATEAGTSTDDGSDTGATTETDSTTGTDSTDSGTDSTTGTDSTDSGTDSTTGTDSTDTGGNGICGPSGGSGGSPGLQEIVAPGYEDFPGQLYVPSDYSEGQAWPLMLALHGAGDTAGNFVNLWQGIAESEGFIVLVPESLSGGASWNPGTDGPVMVDELNLVLEDFNVDECRLYMTGYSAGAHVTYMIGLYNADVFAGLGVQAGSMSYAIQAGIWPNQVPRPIPVDIQHGVNDQVVPISQAQQAQQALEGAGHPVYYSTHPGGHEIGPGDPLEMWTNLSAHSLDE